MDGANWFIYCGKDPANRVDENGNNWEDIGAAASVYFAIVNLVTSWKTTNLSKPMIMAGLLFLAAWMGTDTLRISTGNDRLGNMMVSEFLFLGIATMLAADWFKPVPSSVAPKALGLIKSYLAILTILLAIEEFGDGD